MDAHGLATEYVAAIEALDAARVLALFSDDAVVHSPLYGDLPAVQFFPKMLGDTARAALTLLGSASGATERGTPIAIWYFSYDWTLDPGGHEPTPEVTGVDMVDIAELDDEGRIASFTIVYDASAARPAFTAVADG